MKSIRKIYKDDVDFAVLALQSPEFSKYLKPNGQLDFGDPASVRQLSKSLLQRDFGLKVDLPDDRLCPPIPNRLNYILWLQDLLDTTGDECREDYDPDRDVVGLDMVTRAEGQVAAVYTRFWDAPYDHAGSLLLQTHEPRLIDIDNDNVRSSEKNVTINGLESRIRMLKTNPTDELIPLNEKTGIEAFDFTMCNPPFYASRDEMVASAKAKERPPFSACTGAEVEMVTTGGEIAFVSRMIEESLRLRNRVLWYTSMLGRLSSVSVLVEKLIEQGNNNYAVTEFVQGSKTKRWAIAWSWGDMRPTTSVSRAITGFPKHLLPFPSEFTFDTSSSSIDEISDKVDAEISSLPAIQWNWRKGLSTGVGFTLENVWSRQARRKMKAVAADSGKSTTTTTSDKTEMDIDQSKAALGFKVQLRQDVVGEKGVEVRVRWLKGTDVVLFESFCGMLKRKLDGR